MKREYTINELANILGCSRTAIVKKIKPDENNPVIKRYRNRYQVVMKDGIQAIVLDDIDLEHEKRLSKGVSNVSFNTGNNPQNEDIIDIEPEPKQETSETLLAFTNRYIEQLTTLQQNMYNELKQRDSQILLLTTSEKAKETEYLQVKAENKTLKQRNRVLTVILGVLLTVMICFITYFVTFTTLTHNDTQKNNPPSQNIMQGQVKK